MPLAGRNVIKANGFEHPFRCLLELRLTLGTQFRGLQYLFVHSIFDSSAEAWHRTFRDMLGFDVLDDGTVGSADDQGHPKLAAQERMQVPTTYLVVVGNDAHEML